MTHERIPRDPFAALKKGNPEKDRKHVRRALSFDELRTLVTHARTLDTAFRYLTGPDRAMVYVVAAYSGFRAEELSGLTPECFGERDGQYGVGRSGADTKNGKAALEFLPSEVVGEVRGYLAGRAAGVRLSGSSWFERGADMIRDDATAAGIALDIQTPTGIEVLDFHSLRGTLATMLDAADVPLKVRQTILRHSDPRLTMNRYTKTTAAAVGVAMAALPSVFTAAERPSAP